MPSGYSSKCKTCNSSRRLEIEVWHEKDGMSPEAIEIKLRGLGESISYRAISNHFVHHYNVQEEARARYHQSQEQIVINATERLTDLQILDELIQDNHIIHAGLRKQIKDLTDKFAVPMPAVAMLNGISDAICKAMKTKQELLGEDSGNKKAGAMQSWVDLMLEDEAE
jgi:hypothetical protein